MIRAKATQDIPRWGISEEDVDNYLIRTALSDRQHDTDSNSAQSTDQQRGTPWGKRTTTEQEDIFFYRSLQMPKPITGGTSNANTVRTSTAQTSKFKFKRKHKNPKHIRNISAIVDTGAQVINHGRKCSQQNAQRSQSP